MPHPATISLDRTEVRPDLSSMDEFRAELDELLRTTTDEVELVERVYRLAVSHRTSPSTRSVLCADCRSGKQRVCDTCLDALATLRHSITRPA